MDFLLFDNARRPRRWCSRVCASSLCWCYSVFVAKVAVMSKFATPMRASCPAVLCCKRFPEIKYECCSSPEGAGDVGPQRVPWLFYKYPCVFPQPRRRSFHLPKYSICQTVNNSVSGRDARAVTPRAPPEKNVCPPMSPIDSHASLCVFCTCLSRLNFSRDERKSDTFSVPP